MARRPDHRAHRPAGRIGRCRTHASTREVGSAWRLAGHRPGFGRPHLHPALLAAGLPDRHGQVPSRFAAAHGARAGRDPPRQPEHRPGGLQTARRGRLCGVAPGGRDARHGSRGPAAHVGRAGESRGGSPPDSRTLRVLRRRGRLGRLLGRGGTEAARSAHRDPLRGVHDRRCATGRGTHRRVVRGSGRRGRRPDRPGRRTARPLPLRPGRHVHVPRGRDHRPGRRACPGDRDARRPVVRGAAGRGGGAAARQPGRAGLRDGAQHPEHRPLVERIGQRGRGAADRAPGRRAGP